MLLLGFSPANAVCVVAVVITGLLLAFGKDLLPFGGDGESPRFVVPHGLVLLIGALCFVSFLAEGSVLDWSALALTTLRHVPAARSGW